MQREIKSIYNIMSTIAIAFPEIEFSGYFPAELSHTIWGECLKKMYCQLSVC